MKTKHLSKWAVLAMTAMLAWACSDPVSNNNSGGAVGDTPPGSGSVGGTDSAKVTFEGTTVSLTAGDVYSPKDALTTPDAGLTVSQDSSFFYAGTKSLKLTAAVQQDKYDTTAGTLNSPPKVTEFGARIKVATIANAGATLDLTDKIVTVRVFIPTGSPSTGVQFVLQSNNQQAISPALNVAAGKWTTLSFKADSTKVNAKGKLKLTSVTSTGAFDKDGAYSSDTFEAAAVDQVEIRAVGGAVGAAGVLYVDSIDWAAAASFSATSSPVITDTSTAGTGTDKVTVTLAAGSSGADSIYYTTDGVDPTTASTKYTAPFDIITTSTVKAVAIKSGLANSAVASKAYTIVASKVVSFDLNYPGATGAPASQKVTPSTAATAPTAPTRSGYNFAGWFADAAGTGTAFDFATVITADTVLYAKWTSLPTYTVTFDLNYSGSTALTQQVVSGGSATVPTAPTRTNYTFGGWYTEAAATNSYSFSSTVSSAVTLYAKWTVTPYVVDLKYVGVGYSASFVGVGAPTFGYTATYGLGGFTLPAVLDLTGYDSVVTNATSNGQFQFMLYSNSLNGTKLKTDYPAYGVTASTTADYTTSLSGLTLTSVAAIGIGNNGSASTTVKVNSITFKSTSGKPDVVIDVTKGSTSYSASVAYSSVTFAYTGSYGRAGFALPAAVDLTLFTKAKVNVTSNGQFQFCFGTKNLYDAMEFTAYPGSGVTTSTTATYTVDISTATRSAVKSIGIGNNGTASTTVTVNSITLE